jgi:membrane-associated phospholipid phosphatase
VAGQVKWRVPKSSSRPRWLLPLIVIAVVLPLAMLTARLPGDPEVARFVQRLGIPAWPAAAITSLVTRPSLYIVIAAGVLLATWRGRLRGLVASVILIAAWWYAGEPLKEVVHRPRPSAELVEVVRPSSGYSFPSTFATTWFSVWLPVAVYAWRTRQRSAGLAVSVVAWVALLLGGWARIRMGAHWPSDIVMTFGLVWATFALVDMTVARLED